MNLTVGPWSTRANLTMGSLEYRCEFNTGSLEHLCDFHTGSRAAIFTLRFNNSVIKSTCSCACAVSCRHSSFLFLARLFLLTPPGSALRPLSLGLLGPVSPFTFGFPFHGLLPAGDHEFLEICQWLLAT